MRNISASLRHCARMLGNALPTLPSASIASLALNVHKTRANQGRTQGPPIASHASDLIPLRSPQSFLAAFRQMLRDLRQTPCSQTSETKKEVPKFIHEMQSIQRVKELGTTAFFYPSASGLASGLHWN